MNSVTLIGRLTRDPELSYTANTQTAVCKFTLAINRPRREGKDAEADYPRIVVWGKQAENCDRYLSKGSQVAVLGSIETGSYKDRDGKTVYTTDVVAQRVEFLSSSQNNDTQRKPSYSQSDERIDAYDEPFESVGFSSTDDDLPF